MHERSGQHAENTLKLANALGGPATLVAVDIGNSGIKLGQFARAAAPESGSETASQLGGSHALPGPIATFELPIAHETGEFDVKALAAWCEQHLPADTHWSIGSVHRGAGDLLAATLAAWSKQLGTSWPIRRLTYQDVALEIRVEEPPRVGIDRLLAAVAANCLRAADRAAIVVDLGTAITVDLVEADGAYAGGAILPGIGMSGRALAEQTDALPRVVLDLKTQPAPLGKTTVGCIEAGLYWGAVGAIGELIRQLASRLPAEPDCFITGGASAAFVEPLQAQASVRHEPHLVLAGIALLDAHS